MPLPTLLVKGKLVPPDGQEKTKQMLDNYIPIDYILEWFASRKSKTGVENRVLVLKSETASGKSTAVPAYLYRDFVRPTIRMGEKRGLIITQPRILTAIENVNEMLKIESYREYLKLGHTIGWSTGANKLKPETYGVLSATIGTLTQILRTTTDEELLERYSVILIDETHERDLQTDLTIYLLKNFITRNASNPKCPFLALMSATFDPVPFLAYFGLAAKTNFIYVAGSSFEKREMWDWNSTDGHPHTIKNYMQAAADLAMKIHLDNLNDRQGDILIFMPGGQEIKTTSTAIEKRFKKLVAAGTPLPAVLKIDSDTIKKNGRDYKDMMAPIEDVVVRFGDASYPAKRKIIITTNVAETGLTLDDLKYVIDGGYNRETEFNPIYGLDSLLTKPAPKSRIIQRRGRAGRKFPGVFYPLYPQFIYKLLPDNQLPTILLADFSKLILDICHEQLKFTKAPFDPWTIDMIDQPTPDAIRYALEKAYGLGYIANQSLGQPVELDQIYKISEYPLREGLGLTHLGAIARACFSVGVSLEISRMILAGFTWNCSVSDLITIGAYIIASESSGIEQRSDSGSKSIVNWSIIYSEGLPVNSGISAGDDFTYKARLLLGDGFIDLLILHHAILHCISSDIKHTRKKIKEFCKKVGVSDKVVHEALKARESIIENMLAGGLDAFYAEDQCLRKADESNIMKRITQIKFCIYEGYRLNSLILGEDGVYRTRMGLAVSTPAPYLNTDKQKPVASWLGECQPKYIVYCKAAIKEGRAKKPEDMIPPATVKTAIHCVLDGFVTPDDDFV